MLYSVSNTEVSTVFNDYDKLGNCLKETKTISTSSGDSKTYVTRYSFDIAGRPKNITYPDNYQVSYQYHNGTSLLKHAQGESGLHVQYSLYEPTGKMGQLNFGNNTKTKI